MSTAKVFNAISSVFSTKKFVWFIMLISRQPYLQFTCEGSFLSRGFSFASVMCFL